MLGQKKLFLQHGGKPFYEHILSALSALPLTYLSVDQEQEYQHLGLPMVTDLHPGIGPMGGIYSGLKQTGADALLVTACDMPFLTREAVEQLLDIYRREGKVTIAKTEERIHPLFGIYPAEVLPRLEALIQAGNYRMMALLDQVDCRYVTLDNGERVLSNINTPQELEKIQT